MSSTALATAARPRPIAGAALLAAAFLWAYYPPLQKLIVYWGSNDMYSYGFLVPFIVGYLIWVRWAQLQKVTIVPSYAAGTVVLGGGLLMLVVGRASSTNLVEELSLPVAAAGLTLLVLGRQMTRALAFPLAYTLAMIPFWTIVTDPLQTPFQLFSATMGVAALRLFDIPVLREGVLIYLPTRTLEVADVCSGVNQMVAILCIGVPLAHLNIRRWSKRAVVIVAALAIALVSNGVRVAMISLFAYHEMTGPDGDIHGPYSLLRTTLISAVGFLILFWLIARFSDVRRATTTHSEPVEPPPVRHFSRAAIALAAALLVAVGAFERWHQVTPVPLSAEMAHFPAAIGRWRVVNSAPSSPELNAANFDRTLSRRYAALDGPEIDLLVGYYERQEQGRELVGYDVSRLLAGEGTRTSRPLAGDARVTDFVTTIAGNRYLVTFWYVLDGRVVPDTYAAKLWSTWNALARRRSNGSIVIVRTKLPAGDSVDAARAGTREFLEQILPVSERYLSS